VPRVIGILGLVGGPLVSASAVAVIFGRYGPASHAISALPVFAWEGSVAIYMIVKAFRRSSVTADPAASVGLASA
jgi:hypothetical protein